ncbi:MAG: Gfo/Idh/MocA family oxidoreductase [Tannerellaceae bacterium]|nr:Gfo/Idh/MocA family oxidoreductase [Tannerellaceae bacterium]
METINWGIIGCGAVCEWKSGPAFYKTQHSRLVAVMRRDMEKAKDFAARHQVPRYYTDANLLIHDPEVNAIYIATPPDSHKEYAIRAMQAGKAVYIEKPMALNYQECLEMVQVAEETGQKLFVAHYRRSQDYFLKVKELVSKGIIGDLVMVSMQYFRPANNDDKDPDRQPWRLQKEIAGGGYFYDLAPHMLDIVAYIAGDIQEVKSFVSNRGGYYEVEDTISATFRFNSGALENAIWSFVTDGAESRDTLEFIGTQGKITCNTFAYQPIRVETTKGTEIVPIAPPEHVQAPMTESIVKELRGEGQCPSTGKTALLTAKIMDEIIRS